MRNLIFKSVYTIMDKLGFVHHSPGDIETRKFPDGYHGEINSEYLASLEVLA